MKLRRFLTVTAASALAVTALAAPAAAQNTDPISGAIANLNCDVLDGGLQTVDAYEADHVQNKTTHSELATNIRGLSDEAFGDLINTNFGAGLLKVQYSGDIADRALECGLVAANPELPFGSSQVFDAVPMLELLSSQAK